jgi:hypothetical protein
MKVTQVTYGYKRQPQQFESEHLEITLQAEEGDKADDLVDKARAFVISRLYNVDPDPEAEIDHTGEPNEPTEEEIAELEEHYQIEDYP